MTQVTTQVLARAEEEDVDTLTQPDAPPTQLSKHDAATVIMSETGCNRNEARNMLDWLDGFVQRARQEQYAVQYPTDSQMSGRNYEVFDLIMPHGQAPTPGSAADAASKALLDPTRDETSLWHDQEYDEVDSRYYCSVQVAIGVIL